MAASCFEDTSMSEFAAKLSIIRGIDRPVLDRTGIRGFFEITLESAVTALTQENGPSLFTLIQEQLGLKLEPVKAPVDVLVIDQVEKPSANLIHYTRRALLSWVPSRAVRLAVHMDGIAWTSPSFAVVRGLGLGFQSH
jgi:hypothetical protein